MREARVEAALAKVNIGLFVVGKRKDGYHEIRSIFHLVEIADILVFQPYRGKRVTASEGPQGKDNIVYKALELLERLSRTEIRISIHIDKYIPIGGGMGGGTSDAVTTIRVISDFYALGISESEIMRHGAELGADVPFFLSKNRAAMVAGKGELVTPIRTRIQAYLTVYYPGFPIETKWAYNELSRMKAFTPLNEADDRMEELADCIGAGDIEGLNKAIGNDFEKIVFKRYPELEEAKEELKRAGASVVSLTGSGSCLYAISREPLKPNLPRERVLHSKIGRF